MTLQNAMDLGAAVRAIRELAAVSVTL